MAVGTWLVPGPLRVASLNELRTWLSQVGATADGVALSWVEVDGRPVDTFALCAGLADDRLGTLCVAAPVGDGRLPTILGRELISLDLLRSGSGGLVLIGEGDALAESARIVTAMLADGPVSGDASPAMPAAFAFENRPGPAVPGGPQIVVLEASQRTATCRGEHLAVTAISSSAMKFGPWTSVAAPHGLLVVRDDGLHPDATPLSLQGT